MIFGLLTFIIAISISVVAAYYSILGLMAIFAASAIPVMVMGAVLEAGKLVTAVWLHQNWHRAGLQYKLYLVPAVVLLMFITSMGIFGFLSQAHIEQTAAAAESVAQVQQIDQEIGRLTGSVTAANLLIDQLQSSGSGTDANVQRQIDAEQARVDSAYARIQPAIDEQMNIIDSQTKLYDDQIARIDQNLATLQSYIDSGEVAKAQSLVGARADGEWGPATAARVRAWQAEQNTKRTQLVQQLKDINQNNATVQQARAEIQRLRQSVDAQIADSNRLINRLREQLGQTSATEIADKIAAQRDIVVNSNQQIARLAQQKFQLESDYRKLEAEVGPIKYIAEFVYGPSAGGDILEKAVKWVIILIVAVFDPLAVVMLLAATKQINWAREQQQSERRARAAESGDSDLISEYESEIQTLNSQVSDLESVRDQYALDIRRLQKNLELSTKKTGHHDTERQRLLEQLMESQDTVSRLESEIDTQRQKITELSTQSRGLSADQAKLTEIQQLADQLQQQAQQNATLARNHASELQDLRSDYQTLDADFQELMKNHNVTMARESQSQDQITKLQQQIAELTNRNQSLLDQVSQTQSQDRSAELQAEIAQLSSELHAARAELAQAQTHSRDLAAQLTALTQQPPMVPESTGTEVTAAPASSGFGRDFPTDPSKGDTFMRVDFRPSRLFKWNGQTWIPIAKSSSDAYLTNTAYLDHMVTELDSGQQDWEELTSAEQQAVQQHLGARRG